jgi:D-sedoheptulose 7-phosphate isomerase
MTGPGPNPLVEAADETLCVEADSTAAVQETHLVAVHLLCECFDAALSNPGVNSGVNSGTAPGAVAPRAVSAHRGAS